MGSTTNGITRYEQPDGGKVGAGDVSTVDAATSPAADDNSNDKASEIRSDIESTRSEMGETIDALQEKLNPEHIKDQVVDSVRDATIGRAENMVNNAGQTARGTGSTIMQTISDNPIPAAMIGIGLSWLCLNSSNRAAVAKHQAHAKAADISDGVQHKATQVQHRAEEIAERSHEQANHLATQSHQMLESNPLIAGGLAVALGAVAGFVIPETQRENELLGPTRDKLLGQAKQVAGETAEKVQHVATEATQAAKEAAREEAQSQGLAQT